VDTDCLVPGSPRTGAYASRTTLGGVFPERLRPLVQVTADLADRFRSAGKSLYLVGGSVRDAIVSEDGYTPSRDDHDLDFTTDARPDAIEEIVAPWADAVWTQGKRFGTIGCIRRGRRYEITTHRADAYLPDSRKPEVAFGDRIEDDLARRDFTINAMALRLPDLELIDPFDGLADLAVRRLRTPLDPDVSFTDDPLRMLRAARFIARLELEPDPALVEAVTTGHRRLAIVSAERIRDELDKMMVVGVPSTALWFVVRTGLASEFLPELPGLALEQDPIHRHKDVLAHTLAVVDKTRPDRLLRLAALFHDVGKPRTRAFVDGGVTFHHHEVVGARMTRQRMLALRYPNDEVETVTELVNLHLRFHTYRLGWSDRAVRRYVRDAGPLLDRLNELTRCDCTTRNAAKAKALDRRMDELESRIAELRQQEELDAIRPDLDGTQIMELLGIGPGRDVGRALAFLLELRMDEGPLAEDEARQRLAAWWTGQSSGQTGPGSPSAKDSTMS
jgi:poly(A) polymerase